MVNIERVQKKVVNAEDFDRKDAYHFLLIKTPNKRNVMRIIKLNV